MKSYTDKLFPFPYQVTQRKLDDKLIGMHFKNAPGVIRKVWVQDGWLWADFDIPEDDEPKCIPGTHLHRL